jgi:N-acetyl-gamma-glutamyl-phosphate reductase
MHKNEFMKSPPEPARVPVGIVGARGYSGLELARILLKHPAVKLEVCFANDGAFRLADSLPEQAAQVVPTAPVTDLETRAKGLNTVFLATPAEVSLELAPKLLALGVNAIDLSGAFRLHAGSPAERSARYQQWYGFSHPAPELLERAEFGLVPFCGPSKNQQFDAGAKPKGTAYLGSNPGCYATAVMMGLVPLLRAGAIRPETLVVLAHPRPPRNHRRPLCPSRVG